MISESTEIEQACELSELCHHILYFKNGQAVYFQPLRKTLPPLFDLVQELIQEKLNVYNVFLEEHDVAILTYRVDLTVDECFVPESWKSFR